MSEGLIFLSILYAAFPLVITAAFVTKMWEVRKARAWLSTAGTVVKSEVASRKSKPGDFDYNFDDTEVSNEPLVEYSYKVRGRTFRGRRITISEKTSGFELEEILARYPVGAEVTVYYDPLKPKMAVLERDLPMGQVWLGFGILMLFFLDAPLVAAAVYFDGVAWLKMHLADPGRAPFVAAFTGFGLLVVLFTLAFMRFSGEASKWPMTRGRIVSSEVESFKRRSRGGRGPLLTYYKPSVVYTYEVNGRQYAGDRRTIGVISSSTARSLAKRTTEKYPVGTEVHVYYNPESPGESVLNPRSRWHFLLWIVAAGVLALAWAVATGRM